MARPQASAFALDAEMAQVLQQYAPGLFNHCYGYRVQRHRDGAMTVHLDLHAEGILKLAATSEDKIET